VFERSRLVGHPAKSHDLELNRRRTKATATERAAIRLQVVVLHCWGLIAAQAGYTERTLIGRRPDDRHTRATRVAGFERFFFVLAKYIVCQTRHHRPNGIGVTPRARTLSHTHSSSTTTIHHHTHNTQPQVPLRNTQIRIRFPFSQFLSTHRDEEKIKYEYRK